jgi:hypothetical protein
MLCDDWKAFSECLPRIENFSKLLQLSYNLQIKKEPLRVDENKVSKILNWKVRVLLCTKMIVKGFVDVFPELKTLVIFNNGTTRFKKCKQLFEYKQLHLVVKALICI